MPQEFGLHRLQDQELKRLLRALHRDVFTGTITRSSLIEKAFGHIEAHLDLIVGRDVASAKAVVIAVLAERDRLQGPGAQLVYCGAAAPGTRSRDLVEQVRELVASATRSVDVYGLSVGDDGGLVRTLGALMKGRDVRVRLVFDAKHLDAPAESVRLFVEERFGSSSQAEKPSEQHGLLEVFAATRASFRGRVVIVDDSKVLLTSGELSAREDDGFLDLGVLFGDGGYTRVLADEWKRLLASGVCVPVITSEAS